MLAKIGSLVVEALFGEAVFADQLGQFHPLLVGFEKADDQLIGVALALHRETSQRTILGKISQLNWLP